MASTDSITLDGQLYISRKYIGGVWILKGEKGPGNRTGEKNRDCTPSKILSRPK